LLVIVQEIYFSTVISLIFFGGGGRNQSSIHRIYIGNVRISWLFEVAYRFRRSRLVFAFVGICRIFFAEWYQSENNTLWISHFHYIFYLVNPRNRFNTFIHRKILQMLEKNEFYSQGMNKRKKRLKYTLIFKKLKLRECFSFNVFYFILF